MRAPIEGIGAIGVLGLTMSMVGFYGLISCSVSLRIREIGIRIAVGATRIDVPRMVLTQSPRLTSTGVVLGLLLCLVASKT